MIIVLSTPLSSRLSSITVILMQENATLTTMMPVNSIRLPWPSRPPSPLARQLPPNTVAHPGSPIGAKLVEDSHSFVKYYNGTDVRDYTPFDQAMLTRPATDDSANAGYYAGLS